MKLKLAHICILTRDLEKTRAFYCDALDMEVVFRFHKQGKLFGYYLKMCENNYIEVFEDLNVEPAVKGPFLHLCLETDDIKSSKAKLEDAGIPATDIEKGCDNTYQIWFKDPNGLDIELHQYTAQSSQLTGTDCEVNW